MNVTLMLAFWRQRLTSPFRMAILLLMMTVPMLIALAAPPMAMAAINSTIGLTLVFAIGMIGQDLSSGVLQLLFARPVRRWEYVISRWLAVALASATFAALQVVLVAAIASARGAAPPFGELALMIGSHALECIGTAAVFTLLSSLVASAGDVALYAMITVGAGILSMSAQVKGWAILGRIGGILGDALSPKISLEQLAHGLAPWAPIAAYLSTVTLCLAIAVVVMNRRELSYASSSS